MNYTDAYNFVISLSNLPRKEYLADPKHCGLYLKRLQFFLNILGNPEKKIPHYVHVTGTSGKGSVCLMLESILRTSGKITGLVTSPHPSEITERWEINGKPISKKEFVQLVAEIKPKVDEYIRRSPYDMLSFFEVVTAIGLYYFAKNKVEWAVIEVGCGGRYDSTNVIPHKDLAIITNIGLDHTEILGDTKEKIAYEKAGIIKKGCKVLTMAEGKKVLDIIMKECEKKNIKNIKILNNIEYLPAGLPAGRQGRHVLMSHVGLDGMVFEYDGLKYSIPCLGEHQVKNAVLAIEGAKYLNISDKAIIDGLRKVMMPIRMEVVSKKPLIILDGAHNEDKMKTTIKTIGEIRNSKFEIRDIHLLIGFSENKDWQKMAKLLATLKPKSIACTRFTSNSFRKVADPRLIARVFKKFLPNVNIEIFLDSKEAFAWSKQKTAANDCILITGSIFLSGELRACLLKQ